MDLMNAFQIHKGDLVALVGAGGKTSTMFALGEEARKKGFRAVITTTTRILLSEAFLGQHLVMAEGEEVVQAVKKALDKFSLIVVGAGVGKGNKLLGVERNIPDVFLETGADIVLVEADGSAGLPFKAPGVGEPVIPSKTSLVLPLVGIDCLGRPLLPGMIHRPEMAAALSGTALGQRVEPQTVADVFFHPRGYKKGVPPRSRWIPFINKVDTAERLQTARKLAQCLSRHQSVRVVAGAVLSAEPVKEVFEF